ncbi:unnamed protein product [Arctia plantaginis]|uniref:Uncharacterized protein n=1 Tax=Arctia plantaginis TaxID=874455 RepID=A0A8S0ZZ00_ARCPL|nr:unnamed protein product [Arctia plantaginis]
MDLENISEIWQIEDCLQNFKATWSTIEDLHIKTDNILEGVDNNYEDEYFDYEKMYNSIKLQLNTKLINTEHRYKATPQLEVPLFTGGYTQWPTFFDLFTETIHNNNGIANAQKL